jgi:uncharacterized Zn finger protein
MPTRPKPVKDGLKARSQRGQIGETWWSKRWIGVLESFGMGARLQRGRTYARLGQVVSIDIQKGVVNARVQGSSPVPYEVKIELKPLSDGDWDQVTDAMVSQALFAAKLLSGEMPQNIEEAFAQANIPLLPRSNSELVTACSCPDWANPCKHVAAVYYLLAERFDGDPFLIFQLRGQTREEIMEALRRKRCAAVPDEEAVAPDNTAISPEGAVDPLEGCLVGFWEGGEALGSLVVDPAPPAVDFAVLKRLGNVPFSGGKDNVAMRLEKAYTLASEAALRVARGEG